MNKKERSIADLVGDMLYKNCCSGESCKNCKYNTTNKLCHIGTIIKIIDEYEKRFINEENNKNQ